MRWPNGTEWYVTREPCTSNAVTNAYIQRSWDFLFLCVFDCGTKIFLLAWVSTPGPHVSSRVFAIYVSQIHVKPYDHVSNVFDAYLYMYTCIGYPTWIVKLLFRQYCEHSGSHGVCSDTSVLPCVAVYCSVLQCVAVCCSVLECVPTPVTCLTLVFWYAVWR